ncbi:uncharacterized protein LOC141884547 isoform X4 [Acropora palmata]|uniref:uncharacterized protein LOC141884547 isoform X4 n=1 Tax=Acropora palmata TaxID=6131 RepID=UPI003DA18AC1
MTLVANRRIVLILVSLFHFGNFGHEAKAYHVKTFCQGEHPRLKCGQAGTKKLKISYAVFGRTEPGHAVCPYDEDDSDDNFNCGEIDLTNLFKMLCENKTRCKTKADDIYKLFENPCSEQHGYFQLVVSCAKKYSTPSTESTITNKPTLSTTAPSNVSSALILPTTSVMAIASTSTMIVIQPTMITQKSPKVHSTDTELTTSEGGKLPGIIPQQVESTSSSAVETGNGSLGVAGALFVWFLFWQDHSTDYAMVFFTSAACALALAVIVGVCVLYCHRESKQYLHTVDNSKLKAYEINDSKVSEQVDRFILGPVKTAPPDYMLHEYDWKTEDSKGSQNNLPNGSVLKNFSDPELVANDMNGQSRPALEAPSHRSSKGALVGLERPDGSTIFFKSPFPSSEESLGSKKGRYVNVEDYRKARNKDGAAKESGESYFYYRN